MTQWTEFETAGQIAQAAATAIQICARNAIHQRGTFRLVMAGGTTPISCYQILASRSLDGDKWQLFYGDERCLPVDDPERNHNMVSSTGLTNQIKQHFIMPAELGSIKGAELYREAISDQLPFDIVLLGIGEDGHTASLFPQQEWECDDSGESVIAVHDAPKPPSERISLSCATLQNCRQMLVLVTGESKRTAVQQWRQGVNLPVARVANIEQADVFIQAGLME